MNTRLLNLSERRDGQDLRVRNCALKRLDHRGILRPPKRESRGLERDWQGNELGT